MDDSDYEIDVLYKGDAVHGTWGNLKKYLDPEGVSLFDRIVNLDSVVDITTEFGYIKLVYARNNRFYVYLMYGSPDTLTVFSGRDFEGVLFTILELFTVYDETRDSDLALPKHINVDNETIYFTGGNLMIVTGISSTPMEAEALFAIGRGILNDPNAPLDRCIMAILSQVVRSGGLAIPAGIGDEALGLGEAVENEGAVTAPEPAESDLGPSPAAVDFDED